jgi:hypothetical protein
MESLEFTKVSAQAPRSSRSMRVPSMIRAARARDYAMSGTIEVSSPYSTSKVLLTVVDGKIYSGSGTSNCLFNITNNVVYKGTSNIDRPVSNLKESVVSRNRDEQDDHRLDRYPNFQNLTSLQQSCDFNMHTPEPDQFSKDERIIQILDEWLRTLPEREKQRELDRMKFEMECG